MSVPSPWTTIILVAAAYRIWRLLSEDAILDWPRRKIVRLPYRWSEGDPIPPNYRAVLAEFISCPWCLGWWTCLAIWLAWQAYPHGVTVIAVPFAISAAVGIVRVKLDPPE